MRATGLAELYVPIDVSATFLSQTAAQLRREYPGLAVEPAVADIAEELEPAAAHAAARPCSPSSAARSATSTRRPPSACSRRVRAAMEPGDRFLMGVDLRKDIARIEAAYNDSQGVTAEFNRNMLLVLNHELGADFDPSGVRAPGVLRPRGPPDRDAPRLDARPDGRRSRGSSRSGSPQGESIRTEISTKYDRGERGGAVRRPPVSGSRPGRTDPTTPFGLVVGAPA